MADLSPITTLASKFFGMPLHTSSSSLPPCQRLSFGNLPSSSSSAQPAFDLEALQRMVARIDAVLKDAEEREIRDEPVRDWLKDIRDVANDADDMLDDYEYERLQADAAQTETRTPRGKPTIRLPQTYLQFPDLMITLPPLHTSSLSKLAGQIRKIREKLDEISKLRDTLLLREGHGNSCPQNFTRRPPTSHLLDVTNNPQGRKDDLEKVIGMLSSDECKKSDLFVIPIVGIGGVGKTTLAQLVYDNSEVRSLFQQRGWVSVCEESDLVTLTKRIFEVFTKAVQELNELSVLQEMLVVEIKEERFLLILDDVWNEDPDFWSSLLLPLKFGKQGNAVIITTRNQDVATIVAPRPHTHHRLDCLSKEDCWEVLKLNAFHGRGGHENYHQLVQIGKQIARKCGGLPLAAKSLGFLLSRDYDVESWKDVLESPVWDVDNRIIPALMLSYVRLPSHLKQCFLYASLFPKDSTFSKAELIHLWMAQGFFGRETKELENVGNKYFNELLKRSFFQDNPGDPSLFMMHDLIHDLAQYVSCGEHVIMELGEASGFPIHKVRHLLLHGLDSTSDCDFLHRVPQAVRTILALPPIYDQFQRALLVSITTRLLSLRVLSLRGPSFCRLPEAIGSLKHLRYLSLEHNEIRELPDSIGMLYHLQSLILRGTKLQRLPTSITNLPNLRCLEVGSGFTQMPRGVGRLTGLRSLNMFNVGEADEGCAGVEELKYMRHLRGSLTINNLEHVEDAEKAMEADLEGKTMIWRLDLSWHCYGQMPNSLSHDQQKEVLEILRPHEGLKHLTIHYYHGAMFPNWVTDPCFFRLAVVEIICPVLVALPPFGQLPSLKRLRIQQAVAVQVVGAEFRSLGAVGFPALEELVFEDMPCWLAWRGVRGGDFPSLRRLVVEKCPQLRSVVPLCHLPALEELALHHCEKLRLIEFQSALPPLKVAKYTSMPRGPLFT